MIRTPNDIPFIAFKFMAVYVATVLMFSLNDVGNQCTFWCVDPSDYPQSLEPELLQKQRLEPLGDLDRDGGPLKQCKQHSAHSSSSDAH